MTSIVEKECKFKKKLGFKISSGSVKGIEKNTH
jgi:hypothetical protein